MTAIINLRHDHDHGSYPKILLSIHRKQSYPVYKYKYIDRILIAANRLITNVLNKNKSYPTRNTLLQTRSHDNL